MYAIVSILDDTHIARIKSLWAELRAELGIAEVHIAPVPHISYHVAAEYDFTTLDDILQTFARSIQPFTARTNGLGIFTGQIPVVYLPVLDDPPLVTIHQALWQTKAPRTAIEPHLYYHPNEWRPHITLTETNVDHDLLPQVIRLLSERDFKWSIPVDNIAVIGGNPGNDDQIHGILSRYPLGG
jgi:2'-5' RNA ligase